MSDSQESNFVEASTEWMPDYEPCIYLHCCHPGCQRKIEAYRYEHATTVIRALHIRQDSRSHTVTLLYTRLDSALHPYSHHLYNSPTCLGSAKVHGTPKKTSSFYRLWPRMDLTIGEESLISYRQERQSSAPSDTPSI